MLYVRGLRDDPWEKYSSLGPPTAHRFFESRPQCPVEESRRHDVIGQGAATSRREEETSAGSLASVGASARAGFAHMRWLATIEPRSPRCEPAIRLAHIDRLQDRANSHSPHPLHRDPRI